MSEPPDPLTAADCDLRDFPTMPLDGARLFGSEFHATSSDAAWRAGVTLWLKSWHQVPAASLPDDDVQLARLAEFARDVKSWKKVREEALRGWIKCSDGRLYHPVVAEKANAAWTRKQSYRSRSKKGNDARWNSQKDDQEPSNSDPSGTPSEIPASSQVKGEGEGEGEYTVPNGTGAGAPPGDADKLFWANAKAYLKPHCKGDPGALIGKWARDHGKAATAQVITAAQLERAIEPVPFIEAGFRKRTNGGFGAESEAPLV